MSQLPPVPDLSRLSHAEKDALIMALWTRLDEALARIDELTARGAELEAKLGEPPKTPDNSSVPLRPESRYSRLGCRLRLRVIYRSSRPHLAFRLMEVQRT